MSIQPTALLQCTDIQDDLNPFTAGQECALRPSMPNGGSAVSREVLHKAYVYTSMSPHFPNT